jgi:hypothetical protein
MLDLADVLMKYVPDVFAAITSTNAPALTIDASIALYRLLHGSLADTAANVSWTDAIRAAWANRDAINSPGTPDPLTTPSFTLYNADATAVMPDPPDHSTPLPNSPSAYLRVALEAAIVAQNTPFDPPDAVISTPLVPKLDGRALYIVRCVFQRCALKRATLATLFPSLLSDPSQPFEIAPFFDSDAPARIIRIAMPVDTSPAGLRKFPKSVGFLLSDKLQQQLCQVSDLSGLLKGQLGNCDSLGIGEICCFSIPIITIIAMILMIAMAIVLNLVFWWLPFLKICFPVPTALVSAANEAEEA